MSDARKPSWWQTLPGVLTAVAAILSAITALVVAVAQLPWFRSHKPGARDTTLETTPTQPQERKSPGAVTSPSVPEPRHERAFPRDSQVRVATDRYEILRARLEPFSDDKLSLTLALRLTTGPRGGIWYAGNFRLIADDVSLAPTRAPHRGVAGDAADEDSVTFAFPRKTRRATLRISDATTGVSSSLPLDLSALGADLPR